MLNINKVITYFPQTDLSKFNIKSFDNKYINLNKYINNKTNYIIYCDLSKTDLYHHPDQCYNIKKFKNVKIIENDSIQLKQWRLNGKLKTNLIDLI